MYAPGISNSTPLTYINREIFKVLREAQFWRKKRSSRISTKHSKNLLNRYLFGSTCFNFFSFFFSNAYVLFCIGSQIERNFSLTRDQLRNNKLNTKFFKSVQTEICIMLIRQNETVQQTECIDFRKRHKI